MILAAIVLSFGGAACAQPGPSVAAASDLKFALDEIAARFERGTG